MAAALLAAFAPSGAAQARDTASAKAQAEATLDDALVLLEGRADAEPSREVTLVLAKLSQSLPALDPRDRRIARSILARPDDGPADRYGDGYTVPEAADSPACDADFCVHWVETTVDAPSLVDSNGLNDGDGTPDYIEEVALAAQQSAAVENGTLGWTDPVSDGTRGGGTDKVDVYLVETKPNIFGYASPDEDQGSKPRKRAYLVLDNDFEEFANPPTLTALEAMQATMAHEYNHVLQFAYDSLEDLWMFEAGATWAEEYVYPDIDDYLNYVDGFARSSEVSLTTNDPSGEKIYGAAVWNHYLSGVYGPDVVREAWAVSKQVFPAHLSVGAYDKAIGGDGDNPFETLGDEFVRFASSTAEWRALPGLYPDATELPKVARAGEVTATEDRRPFLDHLSYALIEVEPPESGPIKVTVRGPKGVHYGADLVGRLGTATGGTVVSNPLPDDDGGKTTVVLPEDNYARVTAVVVNADARINRAGKYLVDSKRFTVELAD